MNTRSFTLTRVGAVAAVLAGWPAGLSAPAQSIPVNYDEAKVRSYVLPDPLVLENGERVRDASTWYQRRRPDSDESEKVAA